MLWLVRMRRSQARRLVPGVNELQLRKARAYVSWTRSSASSRLETSRRATRYTCSASSSTSSSKRTRSRSCSAIRRASVSGLIAPDSNSATSSASRLFLGRGREARTLKRAQDVLACDALVVPGEHDLADQVRVRRLETLERLECRAEPLHAPLAADAGHLDRLRLERHRGKSYVSAIRCSHTARSPWSRPSASCSSA